MMIKTNPPNIVAIIPARGGSKGIPRKNIRLLEGIPLIAHTIEQALAAKSVSSVVVSTDDAEIANISGQYGAKIVMRPAYLAADDSTSEEALLHAIDSLEKSGLAIDMVVFLQCTAPIRSADDIENAINLFQKSGADSLLSGVPSHLFLWQIKNREATPANHNYLERKRRQDMFNQYVENGSIYIFTPQMLRKTGNRLGGKIVLYEMDEQSALDIDSLHDLARCELVFAEKQNKDNLDKLPTDIQLVVFDFDGVFTDNRVIVDQDGKESVVANRGDGMGISILKESGLPVYVISKEQNKVVSARCKKLGIGCYQCVDDKESALSQLIKDLDVSLSGTIYVGNDINDLDCVAMVECGIAVADAHSSLKQSADIVLKNNGGKGAVREVCDMIIDKINNG
jgi:YrbI family 3-deoxy-D-manno-octulosonate 8-phosphate phosphatase